MKKKSSRVSKDEYFLQVAEVVSKRATCLKRHVGAVLAKDGMVLSTGYNGSPRGLPHCTEVGCRIVDGRCVRTIHAEANTILQAAYHGVQTQGATLYTLYFPCEYCVKALLNAGVERIVYRRIHKNKELSHVRQMLKEAGVETHHLAKSNGPKA